MSKTHESFINKVIWPLLVLTLTPTFTLIGSKFQSGDWLSWFNVIPSSIYTTFFAFIATWLIIGIVIRRIRRLKERNLPSTPSIFTIPRWGYTTIGTLKYKNVVWRVRIPSPAPWDEFSFQQAQSSRIDIGTPPHCPNCDTELEETETFFGRFRWTCLRCGFSTKNEMGYYHEAVRAEKLAKSWWENEAKK